MAVDLTILFKPEIQTDIVVRKLGTKKAARKLDEDPRDRKVVYDYTQRMGEVKSGTPERLAVLESYAADVDNGRPIAYKVNEDKLYRNELVIFDAMVKAGVITADDLLQ